MVECGTLFHVNTDKHYHGIPRSKMGLRLLGVRYNHGGTPKIIPNSVKHTVVFVVASLFSCKLNMKSVPKDLPPPASIAMLQTVGIIEEGNTSS